MTDLPHFVKARDFLVCVDSDGCAMDTMDIKHIRCFGPCMVKEWKLEAWEGQILDRWNEINLYSMTRGINRFLALEEINESLTPVEGVEELSAWVKEADELSNGSVQRKAEESGLEIFRKALAWSKAVNQSISELPEETKKPFEGVTEGLKAAHGSADVAIVSSANLEAVVEEWQKHGLMDSVDVCLTQNVGSKAYCIGKMLEYGFAADHVLMIGDAPGDLSAAQKNGVLYYPILVKHEKESWETFVKEALPRFLQGTYKGDYQEQQIQAFRGNLS